MVHTFLPLPTQWLTFSSPVFCKKKSSMPGVPASDRSFFMASAHFFNGGSRRCYVPPRFRTILPAASSTRFITASISTLRRLLRPLRSIENDGGDGPTTSTGGHVAFRFTCEIPGPSLSLASIRDQQLEERNFFQDGSTGSRIHRWFGKDQGKTNRPVETRQRVPSPVQQGQ